MSGLLTSDRDPVMSHQHVPSSETLTDLLGSPYLRGSGRTMGTVPQGWVFREGCKDC